MRSIEDEIQLLHHNTSHHLLPSLCERATSEAPDPVLLRSLRERPHLLWCLEAQVTGSFKDHTSAPLTKLPRSNRRAEPKTI